MLYVDRYIAHFYTDECNRVPYEEIRSHRLAARSLRLPVRPSLFGEVFLRREPLQ